MIEINNQRFRNLQEQVAWLTLMINRATDIVKNIAGTAPDVASLAPASTYSNGTTFAIGTAAPYDYYVALNGNWVELGTMPVPGPAGQDGADGQDGTNGTNGKNGNSIFITSQATTSGTSSIITSSIYNPNSLPINAGNLVISEQGDVFEITTPHPVACAVLWRCSLIGPTGGAGPSGPQGLRGATLFEGSDIAYSAGSYSWDSSDWPAGKNPMPGDLYIIASDYTDGGHDFTEGDVFVVYNVLAYGAQLNYSLSLKGSKGDTGSILYNGSDLTYDALGLQVEVALSDVPDIRVDDYYLVASDYTDSGHDFYEGDVFICTSVGVSTADLSYACNVRGPQGSAGSPGSPGATGPSGKGVYISTETTTSSTTSMDPSLIYNPDSRTLGAGDVLISATGDVFTITSISALSVSVTYRESIVGPAGSNGQNGAQGSLIFYGSAVYHTGGSGGAYVIDKTSVPDMRLGDFYLSTSTYTSDGETISSGDLWVAYSDAYTRWVLNRPINLTGPQGSQGPAGPGMPTVTIADAGKFAVVNSSGQWAAVTMAEWSGGSY